MNFSKMHGLGNDFVVINSIHRNIFLSPFDIQRLSDRHRGIGFDQLLLVEKSYNTIFDFNYRIFNANGNEVEQCGNGARCFGLFVTKKKLTKKKNISVSAHSKKLIITLMSNNLIQVNMDEPVFSSNNISYLKNIVDHNFFLDFINISLRCGVVSMGNPHCIIQINCIDYAPVQKIGIQLQKNIIFPNGINVSFMQIINKNYIKLRVYERDVGETKACGSAACAAVAMGIVQKKLNNKVKVDLLGGALTVQWAGIGSPLYMIGPAEHVYDGYLYI
ncbi:diaminopimelate epimerase [Buchnera aphidicola]|uniref:diaminopimelate epimerase n=1 Tax=Buchnera aphidicola TaxID=9 RepID=UPI003464DC45